MVTENTPYRNKKYIVEDIRFDSKFKTDDEIKDLEFDKKFKNEKEIEDLNFKRVNAIGIWDIEGKTEDERVSKLFDKVQDYMGVYLCSLSYCNNRPHPLTAFK